VSSGPPPHVVLVCIDTLRVDHTSVGGYERATTPALERIAAEGTTFERHFANAPWTKPSVATILTGLLPPAHGAQWGDYDAAAAGRPVDVLPEGFDTLPEVLGRRGYATHAYVTNTTLSENLGFAQGIERFETIRPTLQGDEEAVARTKFALDEASGPTFVWCHLMAPHNYQHRPHPPVFKTRGRTRVRSREPNAGTLIGHYRLRTKERAVDVYDHSILFADAQIDNLFDHVRREHPNTLLIVTSDHGEEFGEHGGWLHGRTLYNEMLRVPLVVWGPGVDAGRVVRELTSSIDLFPTIVAATGAEPPAGLQGRSLWATGDRARDVYAELGNAHGAKRAWITREAKWIESFPRPERHQRPTTEGPATWEWFDDPLAIEELDGAAVPEPAPAPRTAIARIAAESQALFEARTSGSETRRRATEEDTEALRALGYVE